MMSKRPYTRRSRQEWQQHIHDQLHSGLSINAYCEQHQLAPSNFYQWRSKLNRCIASTAEPTESDWLAMPAVSPPRFQVDGTRSTITLSLPGGITLSIDA